MARKLGQKSTQTLLAATSVLTHYVYDRDGRLIAELDQASASIREYIWLADTPVALLPAAGLTGPHYIHADHLNTPRVITDQNQRVVWRWDNAEPFGTNVANEDPDGDGTKVTCNLRFPGQYFDRETNNHYNYFRDYSPEIGRYIESDPIGLGGGLNTFAYVESNPIRAIDLQGLASCIYSISTGQMTCISNVNDKPVFSMTLASGNNQGGAQCKNNPKCTGTTGQGPIPQGLWIWVSNPPSNDKPDGRRLQAWIGNKTTRNGFLTHSCTNAFGPAIETPFCSRGCITGVPGDIKKLNQLLDSETGNVLLVVD